MLDKDKLLNGRFLRDMTLLSELREQLRGLGRQEHDLLLPREELYLDIRDCIETAVMLGMANVGFVRGLIEQSDRPVHLEQARHLASSVEPISQEAMDQACTDAESFVAGLKEKWRL